MKALVSKQLLRKIWKYRPIKRLIIQTCLVFLYLGNLHHTTETQIIDIIR